MTLPVGGILGQNVTGFHRPFLVRWGIRVQPGTTRWRIFRRWAGKLPVVSRRAQERQGLAARMGTAEQSSIVLKLLGFFRIEASK